MNDILRAAIKKFPADTLRSSITPDFHTTIRWTPVISHSICDLCIGVSSTGDWVVEGSQGLYVMNQQETYLYALVLLEQPLSKICDEIQDFLNKLEVEGNCWDFFPFVALVKFGFEKGSTYWAKLAFEWYAQFTLEQKKQLRDSLVRIIDGNWASQTLRQKAKKEARLLGVL